MLYIYKFLRLINIKVYIDFFVYNVYVIGLLLLCMSKYSCLFW